MLNIGRLHVLCAVAEQGSMSGAAAAMSYTPSAVSQKIAALERDVGIRLVQRGTHGTSLTDAGRALLRHAQEIFARVADAEEELEGFAGLRTARLRLGAFPTGAAVLAPHALTAFRRDHPGVEVSICELEPGEALAKLRDRELDLALVYEDSAAPTPAFAGVECDYLIDDPLYVALAPGHRLACRERVKLCELADEAWIRGIECGSTLEVLPTTSFRPRIALRTDDHLAVQGCVAAGFGVALVRRHTLPILRRDLALCALDDDCLTRRVGLASPAGSSPSARIATMKDVLVRACRWLAEQLVALEAARTGSFDGCRPVAMEDHQEAGGLLVAGSAARTSRVAG